MDNLTPDQGRVEGYREGVWGQEARGERQSSQPTGGKRVARNLHHLCNTTIGRTGESYAVDWFPKTPIQLCGDSKVEKARTDIATLLRATVQGEYKEV